MKACAFVNAVEVIRDGVLKVVEVNVGSLEAGEVLARKRGVRLKGVSGDDDNCCVIGCSRVFVGGFGVLKTCWGRPMYPLSLSSTFFWSSNDTETRRRLRTGESCGDSMLLSFNPFRSSEVLDPKCLSRTSASVIPSLSDFVALFPVERSVCSLVGVGLYRPATPNRGGVAN
jgi:hypothetical protein